MTSKKSIGIEGTLASSYLSLFSSSATLVCCALPSLLVALGLGAVMAGLASRLPQLVWLSEHKGPVFSAAALMLGLSGWAQWRARSLPCPIDAIDAEACSRARRWSLRVYVVSLLIFLVGSFFAFVAPLIGG